MLLLSIMAVLIALSDLFGPNAKEIMLKSDEKRCPAWIAVLMSLLYPIFCSWMTILCKYADLNLRLGSNDWVFAHIFTYTLISTIGAIIYWTLNS